ncbi:TetR/AcrR family transcriptional regulator [Micromonospora costi]|uniref:TetR/AcrR family transcriptional regulator n=1 Tax=Micromonospora costi TaxID=1530042 RepID=A0A3B0AAK9_9ACTN|nr:TetR/AcrR family transcriptional regulator [Micromonospora costi]RKN57514.1 TetR/AcrR family transcriptional regulator [Micromonospora costi]
MTPTDATATAGSAPPAPRITAAGRRTRDRIVRTAAELMFRKGVAGTSIPDVQQAAKVSASQIYHYFGDKSDLVRAVIRHQIERTLEGQRPLLDRLDSFEALRAWCDEAVEVQKRRNCEGGCEIGSLASELVETCELMRGELVAAFDRWEAPIREGLRRMRETGVLVADADVDHLATAMLAAVQGGLLLTQVRRSPEPLRAATDAAIGYVETFAA